MMRFVLVALVAAAAATTLQETFQAYKRDYKKSYAPEDETHRYECFVFNMGRIEALNAMGAERHGINDFTDMCPEEFKVYHNLVRTNTTSGAVRVSVPAEEARRLSAGSIDWRTKGAVTHVKNQGQCGSCWTFSAVGAMEGVNFLKNNKLVGFSEQELVSCAKSAGDGCGGGWMDKAIEWVVNNGGIDTETDYPYTSGGGSNGRCNEAKEAKHVGKFSKVVEIEHSEDQMAAYVTKNGPISIGVDASQHWQTYHGGIVKNCNGRQIDHGVTAVGFGEDAGTPYWIVKNSWGTGWGESGYIRLEKGTNQCDISGSPASAIAA